MRGEAHYLQIIIESLKIMVLFLNRKICDSAIAVRRIFQSQAIESCSLEVALQPCEGPTPRHEATEMQPPLHFFK